MYCAAAVTHCAGVCRNASLSEHTAKRFMANAFANLGVTITQLISITVTLESNRTAFCLRLRVSLRPCGSVITELDIFANYMASRLIQRAVRKGAGRFVPSLLKRTFKPLLSY